jgi:hypothetical protein
MLLLASPLSVAQTIFTQFDGDIGAGGSATSKPTYRDHPDATVAANGSQVVEVTGQNVNVYSYEGKLLKSTRTSDFINNAGVKAETVSNPRIIYDPFVGSGRWIVTCSCSGDFVIVSSGPDAASSTWKGVALSGTTGDLTMKPGFDKNGLYVTEYAQQGFLYQGFAIPSADLNWSGTKNISLKNLNRFQNLEFEIMPAIDWNPSKLTKEPAYWSTRTGPNQQGTNVAFQIVVRALTWSGSTAKLSEAKLVPTSFEYNTPVDEAQPGPPNIRGMESHRTYSVQQAGDHLHVLEASGPSLRSGEQHNLFFWLDIKVPSMKMFQSAKIASPSIGFLFPSLAVDKNQNVLMVATGVSSMQYASVYLFSHSAKDKANAVKGPALVTPGTAVYGKCNNKTPVGWGTYTTVVNEAGDLNKMWVVSQYANSTTPCKWYTRLLQVQLAR